jgi:hypothetical protein
MYNGNFLSKTHNEEKENQKNNHRRSVYAKQDRLETKNTAQNMVIL